MGLTTMEEVELVVCQLTNITMYGLSNAKVRGRLRALLIERNLREFFLIVSLLLK